MMLGEMSDEKIVQVIRATAEYISGNSKPNTDEIASGSVASLIDEICERIDDAENKRQKNSAGGKKGMGNRYNSSENQSNIVISELQDSYNSVITTSTSTSTSTNINTKKNTNTSTHDKYTLSCKQDDLQKKDTHAAEVKEIIDYLNAKTGKHYSPKAKKATEHIHARLNEGYCVDDFKRAIDNKVAQWAGTQWEKFLRPSTLFNSEKFEGYANETPVLQETLTKTAQDCDRIAGWLERRKSQ